MWERELLVLSALTWKSGSSSTDETIVERMRVPWSTYSSHFSCSSWSNWNCGNTSVFFFSSSPAQFSVGHPFRDLHLPMLQSLSWWSPTWVLRCSVPAYHQQSSHHLVGWLVVGYPPGSSTVAGVVFAPPRTCWSVACWQVSWTGMPFWPNIYDGWCLRWFGSFAIV